MLVVTLARCYANLLQLHIKFLHFFRSASVFVQLFNIASSWKSLNCSESHWWRHRSPNSLRVTLVAKKMEEKLALAVCVEFWALLDGKAEKTDRGSRLSEYWMLMLYLYHPARCKLGISCAVGPLLPQRWQMSIKTSVQHFVSQRRSSSSEGQRFFAWKML